MAAVPLPLTQPLGPMLAKSVKTIPTGDYLYEPKWDGFRCIAFRDGDEVELASRGEKPLTRYFPEVVEALRANLPHRCVVDGEVVIATGDRLARPGTIRQRRSRQSGAACGDRLRRG